GFAFFGKASRAPDGSRRRFSWSPTYLGLLVAGAASYGMQRTAYEYSRTLLFVVALPLIVDALSTLLSAILRLRILVFAAQWGLLFALLWHGVERSHQEPSLDAQLAMLADVRRATTSDDCVY